MTPVYEQSGVQLYQGDVLEVLADVDDSTVDAIVTDPPYCSGAATEAGKARSTHQGLRTESVGSGKRFAWFGSDNMTTGGVVWLMRSVAVEAFRLLVEGGSLCVFCDWRMAPVLAPALESAGLRLQNLVVWDKGSMGLGRGFRMQHELVLHLTKGVGVYHDESTGNVIRTAREGNDRVHPTQKPLPLLQRIVRVVAPGGGLVVDPFAGSGSTAVACVREGRRCIAADRRADYLATAAKRLDECGQQASLPLADAAEQLALVEEVSP